MSSLHSVLITGTSSGIGHETALLFAERGWEVIACTRDGSGHPDHPRIKGMTMDIDDPVSIDVCFATLQQDDQIPSVLVNNAGWGVRLPFEKMKDADIEGILRTNVLGTMRVTKAWIALRTNTDPGVLMTISSFAGRAGLAYHSVYAASKWAVEGWMESLCYELSPKGIRVKLIEPYNKIDTAFFAKAAKIEKTYEHSADYDAYKKMTDASGWWLQARDVAEVIFRAATDGRSKIRYPVSRGFSLRAFALLHAVWPSLAIRLLRRRYRSLGRSDRAQHVDE
ncbi:SDR family NAD(P)-dependent oxidoreductase [Candidatus Peribacteria bacterium]|nr:MAG: SDR family NAD(P)-dependent oxidoreductase [Candidatus Peribacteria bacterium]